MMVFFRKLLFFSVTALVWANFSYAEEEGIASRQEAVNYYNEGVKAQKSGNFESANRAYTMVSILSPRYNKFILNNKGVMYVQQGDLKKAEQAFRQALQMDPIYMPAKLNLGLIYDKQEDKCKTLKYWADVFNLEKAKPKAFVIEEQQKASDKE